MLRNIILPILIIASITSLATLEPLLISGTSTQNIWLPKAALPEARASLGATVVNGKLYAIGGYTITDGACEIDGKNMMYDPETDDWIIRTPMPVPVMSFAIAVYENKIYCMGGKTSSDYAASEVNQVYDPANDTWAIVAPLPAAKVGAQANVADGKIFLLSFTPNETVNQAYDPKTDTWSTKTPHPFYSYTSTVIDNEIYCLGIYYYEYEKFSATVIYNPETDTWRNGTNPPSIINNYGGGSALALTTNGQKATKQLYVLSESSNPNSWSLQIFNPANDTWSNGPDLTSIIDAAAGAVIDDKLYVVGGLVRNYTRDPYYMDTYPVALNQQYTPLNYGVLPPQTQAPNQPETPLAPVALLAVLVVAAVVAVLFFIRKRKVATALQNA